MVAECGSSVLVSADLLASSQRRETLFESRASATCGRRVDNEASSTRRVSTLLHAAG